MGKQSLDLALHQESGCTSNWNPLTVVMGENGWKHSSSLQPCLRQLLYHIGFFFCRWCAVIATHNNLPDQITDKPLSVVQKALFYNPVFYTQQIFANAQTTCTFLERSFLCVRRR